MELLGSLFYCHIIRLVKVFGKTAKTNLVRKSSRYYVQYKKSDDIKNKLLTSLAAQLFYSKKL